tara:strand:- start:86217 stop:86903 length:687 start_codon:yes stop_codon:yes gene_type:complete
MDIRTLDAPAIHQHNCQTAREVEVALEVDRLLRLLEFPFESTWVDLRFDPLLAEHSASKVTAMAINGDVHGVAEIRLQPLFLFHDFRTFFEEVIPHEVAHVVLSARRICDGSDNSKPHDDEWVELVSEINPDCEPAAKVKGEFDDRPIKIHKGGLVCTCDCCDLDSIAVFPNTASTAQKLKSEELACSHCFSPYRKTPQEDWPAELKPCLAFYQQLIDFKAIHPILSR